MKNTSSLALLILAAFQTGRAVAVKVAQPRPLSCGSKQNLWTGAKAWLEGRTQRAQSLFVMARGRLRQGQAKEVVQGQDIKGALALEGSPTWAHQTLTNLCNYLDKHRDQIDYAKFKDLGVPMGSGIVVSPASG